MSSVCTTNCINDAGRPPRATYVDLYKWAESDAEFVKSRGSRGVVVADGVSCRQMYLRSYRFSTKETVPEKTRRCLGRVREKMDERKRRRSVKRRKRKCLVWRKMKEFSCNCLLLGIFQRILSCAASIDVVEQNTIRSRNRF